MWHASFARRDQSQLRNLSSAPATHIDESMSEQDLRALEHAMAAMPGNPILVMRSIPCPGVVVLTLNRPEKRNALSQALINNLLRELTLASNDPAVKAVVLSGGPAFFCGKSPAREAVQSKKNGQGQTIRVGLASKTAGLKRN